MKTTGSHFKDYDIFRDDLDTITFSGKIVINTINQYSFCIAEQDPVFKKALLDSDILLPDGIGIVLAVRASSNDRIRKISGADLHRYLASKLDQDGGKSFYLGSSDNTLQKINERLALEHPNIQPRFFSPPFKALFSDLENDEMINQINEYNPEVLFVGMTAPKQEKWVAQNKHRINAKIICSIGAVFDFYAGTVARPKEIWINLGLEWFVRLVKEPKRMWRRYLYYGPIFVFDVFKEIVKSDAKIISGFKTEKFRLRLKKRGVH